MKKHDIRLIIMFIILLTTVILLKIFSIRSEGILIKYAKNKAINTMSQIVDKTIRGILIDEECNNIIFIEKNDENQITNLNFDNNKINRILNNSTEELLKQMQYIENNSNIYDVSFGLIIDNHLLNNLGPSIPYMVDTLGEINTNAYINIKEYGINNSMIEVILNINIEFQILLPFVTDTFKINKDIILDSKIIQGNIPDYYSGVNSLLK